MFIIIGANIDEVETVERFGISANRTQSYHTDSKGMELNFCVQSEAVVIFRECSAMPEGWSEEIQKHYKTRGGR